MAYVQTEILIGDNLSEEALLERLTSLPLAGTWSLDKCESEESLQNYWNVCWRGETDLNKEQTEGLLGDFLFVDIQNWHAEKTQKGSVGSAGKNRTKNLVAQSLPDHLRVMLTDDVKKLEGFIDNGSVLTQALASNRYAQQKSSEWQKKLEAEKAEIIQNNLAALQQYKQAKMLLLQIKEGCNFVYVQQLVNLFSKQQEVPHLQSAMYALIRMLWLEQKTKEAGDASLEVYSQKALDTFSELMVRFAFDLSIVSDQSIASGREVMWNSIHEDSMEFAEKIYIIIESAEMDLAVVYPQLYLQLKEQAGPKTFRDLSSPAFFPKEVGKNLGGITEYFDSVFHQQEEETERRLSSIESMQKKLQKSNDKDIVFEVQNSESVQKDLQRHPKRRRAVFVEGKVKDGILYAHLSHKSVQKQKYLACHQIYVQDEVGAQLVDKEVFDNLFQAWYALPFEDRDKMSEQIGFCHTQGAEPKDLSSFDIDLHIPTEEPNQVPSLQQVTEYLKSRKDIPLFKEAKYSELLAAYAQFCHQALQSSAHYVERASFQPSQEQIVKLGGSLSAQDEKSLIEALEAKGGVLQRHSMALPLYDSWTDLQPGDAWVWEDKKVRVSYVPHHSKVARKKEKYCFSLDVHKHRETLIKRFEEKAKNVGVAKEDFGVKYRKGKKGDLIPYSFLPLKEFVDESKEYRGLQKAIHAGQSFCTSSGETIFPISRLSTEDKQNFRAEYIEAGGYMLDKQTDFGMALEILVEDSVVGCLEMESKYNNKMNAALSGEDYLTRDIVRFKVAEDLWQTRKEVVEYVEEQNAPLSERGQLVVESQDVQSGLQALQELGVVSEVPEHVPTNLLYGNKNFVSPIAKDYLKSPRSLQIPKDHVVLHGLTGCDTESEQAQDEVLQRLQSIFRSGGLSSIASRRHAGIEVETLSPLGDIASGIDHGVPTTIGKYPQHGEGVIFVMKPSVLKRRDVWFAEMDYGGGESRTEKYDYYARGLGQKDRLDPPSHEARQKHLDNIKNKKVARDNEAYFADCLSEDEIDVLLVDQCLYDRVLRLQKTGIIPEHINIQAFEGSEGIMGKSRKDLQEKIKAIYKQQTEQ